MYSIGICYPCLLRRVIHLAQVQRKWTDNGGLKKEAHFVLSDRGVIYCLNRPRPLLHWQ